MNLVDTHCHIHFNNYGLEPGEVITSAAEAGVAKLLCVGTTLEDSEAGIDFAKTRENVWASIGIHPHEARHYVQNPEDLQRFANLLDETDFSHMDAGGDFSESSGVKRTSSTVHERRSRKSPASAIISNSVAGSARQQVAAVRKIVAVGEAGLDYYYNHSPKEAQREILEFQLQLAQSHDLPVIFHVRDAFDEFWPVFDNFKGLQGVLHSFTAGTAVLEEALKRDLYIGLNGIMTFTKDENQLIMAKNVPLERLLLETDAPFLTPVPFRGTICEPKHLVLTAQFLADLRDVSLEELAEETSKNSSRLFKI